METKKLDSALCVREQILPGQMAEAARLGFRSVINARPDGEDPGQPTSDQVAAAAHAAGLEYRHIPVIPDENQGHATELEHEDGEREKTERQTRHRV